MKAQFSKRSQLLSRLQSVRSGRAGLFAGAFVFLGLTVVIITYAAGPSVAIEPENGTIAGAAAVVNNAGASGGKAVQMGANLPAYCSSGGSQLWANLETCGWPGPGNTGPDLSQCPGGVLTNNSGATTRKIVISTAGTVINCQNITGGLEIAAPNVTVQNSKVAWDGGGAGGYGVITIDEGASATVDHVELNGLSHTHACIFNVGLKGAALAYSLVAKSVNCHHVDDGIFSWWWAQNSSPSTGSDFVIQDSYFHDFTQNAANGHIDGFQTEGAQNGLITHNSFKIIEAPGDPQVPGGGLDSALAIWNDWNEGSSPTGHLTTNITVSNNLITGGGFAAYAEDRSPGDGSPGNPSPVGGNQITNIHFNNNSFSTYYNQCVGEFGTWFYRGPDEGNPNLIWPPYYGGPTDGWNQGGSSRSGNKVLETGENVDNSNPHRSGGSLCT